MIRHQCPHPYHQTKRQRKIEQYALLIVIVGLILFFLIGRFSVKSIADYQIDNAALQASVEELTDANKELLRQKDFVENSKKIDVQAQKDSRRSLTILNDELSEVKQELAFYQRVVAPETITKGLYIDSFKVNAKGEEGVYQYKLIVAQGVNKKRAIKGRYTFSVLGKLDGKEKVFLLKDMLASRQQSKGFVFRYYELLTGTLVFAKGFEPEQIVVTVSPTGKTAKEVRQQWFWREVIKSKF